MKRYDMYFGVFCDGELLIFLGRIKCTHAEAIMIVEILDMAKDVLKPGHYFACDYWRL